MNNPNYPDKNTLRLLAEYRNWLSNLHGSENILVRTLNRQFDELLSTMYSCLLHHDVSHGATVDSEFLKDQVEFLSHYFFNNEFKEPLLKINDLVSGKSETANSNPDIQPNEALSSGQFREKVRDFAWAIVHNPNSNSIKELAMEWTKQSFFQNRADHIPTEPEIGDLILYGAVQIKDIPPIWIAAHSDYFSVNYPQYPFSSGRNIWVSFDENWLEKINIAIFSDFQFNLQAYYKKLAAAWINFINWTIFVPEAIFIVNDLELAKTSEEIRDKFMRELLRHNEKFNQFLNGELPKPNFISPLHYLYSALKGKVLMRNSFNSTQKIRTVFDLIHEEVDRVFPTIRSDLSIQESKPISYLKDPTSLPTVISETLNRVGLKPEFTDFLGGKNFKESQVIFWYKPFWKVEIIDPQLPGEYLGAVLYANS